MGAWGEKAWDNDGAADWFAAFFKDLPIGMIRDALKAPPQYNWMIDEARAACHVLQSLAVSAHVWPGDGDEINQLLSDAIDYLENVLNPPSPDWYYIDTWTDREAIKHAVWEQIEGLKELM